MASQKVGGWAFILGVVIAIVAGLASTLVAVYSPYVLLVLVVLGLIVGFLNIKDKQVVNFLIAAIALMAVGTANLISINMAIPMLGTLIQSIVQNIAAFVAPAALVVALKEVYNIANKI
jgi:hypothetical protein